MRSFPIGWTIIRRVKGDFFDWSLNQITETIKAGDIIFDILGLTKGAREAGYEAVVNLVRTRLKKARNIKK